MTPPARRGWPHPLSASRSESRTSCSTYNAELAALRTSARAHNFHRLDDIAYTSKNDMARVAAVKAMETIADQADEKQRPGAAILPGLQIVIVNSTSMPKVIGPAPFPAPATIPPQTIDHEPARAE